MLISPSKKCYIGQTNNVKRRFREHRRATGGCRHVHNAIRKYGWGNFLKVIIEVFDDDVSEEFIDEREIYWIKEHNTLSPNGYNLDEGGNGPRKLSEETRLKMKIYHKNRPPEHQSKITRAMQERILSEEQKEQCRKNLTQAVKTWTGQTHTDATKAKMSRGIRDYYENRSEEQITQHKEKSYQNAKKYMKSVIATEKKTGIERKFESTHEAARTLANETGKKFNRATYLTVQTKDQTTIVITVGPLNLSHLIIIKFQNLIM